MMQQQNSIKYTSAAFIWLLFILVVLFMPTSSIEQPKLASFPGGDKIVHFILFAVLTFLVAMALKERKIRYTPMLLLLVLSSFGLTTELVQIFLEERNGDVWDWIADTAGVGCILLIFKIY